MITLMILLFIVGLIIGAIQDYNDDTEVLWGSSMFTGGDKPSTEESKLQVMYTSVWMNQDE